MGTGKSAVGPRLASALQYSYVDLDHSIEQAAGMKVAEIFAKQGEAAFRSQESAALTGLADTPSMVVSTGGGVVLSAANRDWMASHGHVVCLTATADEIFRRTRRRTTRPLLNQAEDPLAHIVELLAERRDAYQQCHHLVDTTERPVTDVVAEIVRLHQEGAWRR